MPCRSTVHSSSCSLVRNKSPKDPFLFIHRLSYFFFFYFFPFNFFFFIICLTSLFLYRSFFFFSRSLCLHQFHRRRLMAFSFGLVKSFYIKPIPTRESTEASYITYLSLFLLSIPSHFPCNFFPHHKYTYTHRHTLSLSQAVHIFSSTTHLSPNENKTQCSVKIKMEETKAKKERKKKNK